MTDNYFGAEKLQGRDIINMFISAFIDQVKILRIELKGNEPREKIVKQCEEIIKAARTLQQMLLDSSSVSSSSK